MYSYCYRYISIYPVEKHNTLPTTMVESIIMSYKIFKEKANGNYVNKEEACIFNMQLMKVSNYNSWSSKDFDTKETNFISVIVSREDVGEEPVMDCLIEIAQKLQWVLFEEDDEEGEIIFSPM